MSKQTMTIATHDPCPVCGGFDSAQWEDSSPGWDEWRCRGCNHNWAIVVDEPSG